MKKTRLYLIVVVLCLVFLLGKGLAETMYVTDRLYLSLRKGPGLGEPSLGLLESDTKVDVLETKGNWARITTENGRTGWVMKRYLVNDLPKSLVIKQLEEQIGKKDEVPEMLKKENVSLKQKIKGLEDEIIEKTRHIETTGKESTLKRLKEIYATGILAFIGGAVIGWLARRPKKPRRY
jgi:SH3 domain protein